MSKFIPLWEHIQQLGTPLVDISFHDAEHLLGGPLDGTMVRFTKELLQYGYVLKKIGMKEKTLFFRRVSS